MKASVGSPLLRSDIQNIVDNLVEYSFEGKNSLVIGGAGFLGSWICESLLNLGSNVICVDNLSSGLESNINDLKTSNKFEFYKHDISFPFKNSEKIDFVFHMASRASPFEFEHFPLEILKSNTVGIINALEIARLNNARFLFTSTSEVYGNPTIVPTPESYYGYVNPVGIRGCYDEGKRCGEAYVMAYKRQYGLDVRIARIFNTYGPRIRSDGIYGRAIPRFLSQALDNQPITIFGNGRQTRSFCYVTDQIEGLLRFIGKNKMTDDVLNIGNDNEITILDMAYMIKRLTKSKSVIKFSDLPPDDPIKRRPMIDKVKNLLNWIPKIKLEEGLIKTSKYFKRKINVVEEI